LYGKISRGYTEPQIEYCSHDAPGNWVRPHILGAWFPDAFYGTMFELMSAIQEEREPTLSGRDNLNTLKLLFRMIQSNEQKEWVRL
jgi:predicted dehydrogenase